MIKCLYYINWDDNIQTKKYFRYIRVNSKRQNEEKQINALHIMKIRKNNKIYEFIKENEEFNQKIEVEIINTNIDGINEMLFGHKY